MISAVDFICLETFKELKPASDLIALSVGDLAQMPPANLDKFVDSLRLEFLDVEPSDLVEFGLPVEVLCTTGQIDQLVEFIRSRHEVEKQYRVVAHCRLGSSRSAAVALVVHALTGCEFPRHPDAHNANRHVVELARAATGRHIDIPARNANGEPHEYLPLALQI
jgi:predicted protein tyrosine phosphatase